MTHWLCFPTTDVKHDVGLQGCWESSKNPFQTALRQPAARPSSPERRALNPESARSRGKSKYALSRFFAGAGLGCGLEGLFLFRCLRESHVGDLADLPSPLPLKNTVSEKGTVPSSLQPLSGTALSGANDPDDQDGWQSLVTRVTGAEASAYNLCRVRGCLL